MSSEASVLHLFQPSTDMVGHWVVFALYASLIMTFFRVLGRGLGPVVQQKSPTTYTVLKSLWSALEAVMNDAFKMATSIDPVKEARDIVEEADTKPTPPSPPPAT